jgi:hypothetical protein
VELSACLTVLRSLDEMAVTQMEVDLARAALLNTEAQQRFMKYAKKSSAKKQMSPPLFDSRIFRRENFRPCYPRRSNSA